MNRGPLDPQSPAPPSELSAIDLVLVLLAISKYLYGLLTIFVVAVFEQNILLFFSIVKFKVIGVNANELGPGAESRSPNANKRKF